VPRPHTPHIRADDLPATAMPAGGWPGEATVQLLSRDPVSFAMSALVTLAPGFRRERGSIAVANDVFVLAGSLRVGEHEHGFGYYEHAPPGAAQQPWSSPEGCRLILLAKGRPDFETGVGHDAPPGSIRLESERMPWRAGRIPGPPPGLFSKTLRNDDVTGERVFLSACVRRYDYPLSEYHDCAEESFRIAGDMRLGTTGLLTAGSYYWRPPFVTHGPFYSRSGSLAFMTVDGPLVNHYIADPWRGTEDNREEARARRARHDPRTN
jgi:hypothetical protein